MDESLKKRLLGAAVLASLAVIFVPMLVDKRVESPETKALPRLPKQKPVEFKSKLLTQEILAPQPVPKRVPAPDPVPEPVRESKREPVPEPTAASVPVPETTTSIIPEAFESGASTKDQKSVDPVASRIALGSWIVQVGSFGSRDNAQRLVEKLRDAEIDTMAPERVEVGGKTRYRVLVGPEIDRERAEALLPKIKKISQLQGQVYSYP